MGENQGIIWIIIAGLVVAGASIALGLGVSDTLESTGAASDSIASSALSEL